MRVQRIRCFSLHLPLATGGYEMSHGRRLTGIETTVVEVLAEDGTVGYGEACTSVSYIEGFAASVQATVRELAPIVLRSDVFEHEVLLDRMDAALRGQLPGKAAIDAAMWDLRGKILGMPVWKLLGGCHQSDYRVFHALTLASGGEMAAEARRMIGVGYRAWQLKVGNDPIEDAERVHSVFEAIEGKAEFVTADANCGWTAAQTLRFIAAIKGRDTYIEQPCRTLSELRQVRLRSTLPVIADEVIVDVNDLLSCLACEAADAINIKPARVGGLTKAARIRDLAQIAGLMIMIDEPFGGDLATAGISHLAAGCRPDNFLGAAQPTDVLIGAASPPIARSGAPRMESGRAFVSDRPGLGIDVDGEALGEPLFSIDMRSTAP